MSEINYCHCHAALIIDKSLRIQLYTSLVITDFVKIQYLKMQKFELVFRN